MFDVATARIRLDVEGDSQDASIAAALNVSLAVAENYCDRRFAFVREVARFPLNAWPVLMVRRYPIARVYGLTMPPNDTPVDVSGLEIHHEFGQVFLQGCGCAFAGGARGSMALDYEGGFKVLPADLEQALWFIFDQVWAANPGMGGDSAAATGGVRQFAIDGMSLTFDTSASEQAASQADGSVGAWGLIPLQAATLLQFYRAETVLGAA